jgi:hypothetical protein
MMLVELRLEGWFACVEIRFWEALGRRLRMTKEWRDSRGERHRGRRDEKARSYYKGCAGAVEIYEIPVCWGRTPDGSQCGGWSLTRRWAGSVEIRFDDSMTGRTLEVDGRRRWVVGQMVMD